MNTESVRKWLSKSTRNEESILQSREKKERLKLNSILDTPD